MEAWIYRIMAARDPNWRTLARDPASPGVRETRRENEIIRRER